MTPLHHNSTHKLSFTDSMSRDITAAGIDDVTATFDVVETGGSGGRSILAKCGDGDNCWILRWHPDNNVVQLYERDGGTFRLRDSASLSGSYGTEVTLKLVWSGQTIIGYVDDTEYVRYGPD